LKYAMSASSSTEHTPDSDTCEQCKDARTIVLPTDERYRVCAPNNWKSYEFSWACGPPMGMKVRC
jgi:hypothetical protein